MRCIILLFGFLSLIPPCIGEIPRSEVAERAAVQSVLDAHGSTWTKGDAAAATAIMTEDADWVGSSGLVLHGREQIRAAHEQWLKEAKGSRHAHTGTSIRFLRPDVALVDGDSYMAGLHDATGKELPPQLSRYSAILVKHNGRWLVTAFRSLPQVRVKQPD